MKFMTEWTDNTSEIAVLQAKDLYFFINSPRRWVLPGISIYDTMQFVPPKVHIICMGLTASMGSFILVGGTITKRLAFSHAWCQ